MGTRSLTTVRDGNQEILVLYRHWDGGPTSHGAELKEFAGGMAIVNGAQAAGNTANGMGCFAAQLVAHFKKEPGGFYLYAPETREVGEEYVYNLSEKNGRVWLDLYEGEVAFFGAPGSKPELFDWLFSGYLADFDPAKAEAGQVHHGARRKRA